MFDLIDFVFLTGDIHLMPWHEKASKVLNLKISNFLFIIILVFGFNQNVHQN